MRLASVSKDRRTTQGLEERVDLHHDSREEEAKWVLERQPWTTKHELPAQDD